MNYSRFRKKRRALAIVAVAALAVAVFLIQYGAVLARAEEGTTTAWALCRTYINIRLWPSKKATEVGYLDPCDPVETDGRTTGGTVAAGRKARMGAGRGSRDKRGGG